MVSEELFSLGVLVTVLVVACHLRNEWLHDCLLLLLQPSFQLFVVLAQLLDLNLIAFEFALTRGLQPCIAFSKLS